MVVDGELPVRSEDRCTARVLMRNLSLSRLVSPDRSRPSSSLLADDPERCSVRYLRRTSMRSSTVACRSRCRSKSLDRRREEFENSAAVSLTSAPSGGASLFSLRSSSPPSPCSGRRSRRLQATQLVFVTQIRQKNSIPERAGARHVDQPGVYTRWVEFVVAGKHAYVLANSKVFCAD